MLLLVANLSFADREGLFSNNSFLDALITLFLYLSNKTVFKLWSSGKYLDDFVWFLEKLVKKNFTILSSIEWKLTTSIFPPGLSYFVAFIIPSISSVISLFTNILKAWKVLVLGLIFFGNIFFLLFSMILTNSSTLVIFFSDLAFTIFLAINFASFSSPSILII